MASDLRDLLATGDGDDEGTERAGDGAKGRAKARPSPRHVLARNTLLAALGSRERRSLRSKRSKCVILTVPSEAWKRPIADAATRFGPWHSVCLPAPRKRASAAPDINGTEVAESIAAGLRVLVVTDDPGTLVPGFMLTAADLAVVVSAPSDEVVRRTIAQVTRRRLTAVPKGIAAGLGYEEILAAIRVSTAPDRCIVRLQAAGRRDRALDPAVAASPGLDTLTGYGDAMHWCQGLVADLSEWRAGAAPFPPAARVVFSGPPGTGKTTLVRALAKTTGLPLIATSVGDWFAHTDGHLGDVVKAIRMVFEAARLQSPCILFLDELDAVPNRATLTNRAREWWTPLVNYLLTMIDGANPTSSGLVVIGATNYGAALDAALVRPGRLERIIDIAPPATEADCEGVMRHHLAGKLKDEDLSAVTPLLVGMTGAEIMALVRDACRLARSSSRPLSVSDLLQVLAPAGRQDARELRRSAVHEAGHALGARAVGHEVSLISLAQSGRSAGKVRASSGLDGLPTRADLEDYIVVSLCATAAEERLLGDRSIGAGGVLGSDIERATSMMAAIHASFGLGETLSFRVPAEDALGLLERDPALRSAVERDLNRLFAKARAIVAEHERQIEAVAERLGQVRMLSGQQLEALLADFDGTDAPQECDA